MSNLQLCYLERFLTLAEMAKEGRDHDYIIKRMIQLTEMYRAGIADPIAHEYGGSIVSGKVKKHESNPVK